jgi:hypothetical protein
MLKLRSMMEDMAEKLFGRYVPQVRAQASNCEWQFVGCCGDQGSKIFLSLVCGGSHTGHTSCEGICPT